MPRQQFRNAQGARRRTLTMLPHGYWTEERDGIHEASTDPALEEAMRPFLADLTIPQRDAVRLVWWERLDQRTAADRLGIAQPTLHERLQGAYKKLRKALVEAVTEPYVEAETYRAVRQMLTPSEVIDIRGVRDRSEEARCIYAGEFLAQFTPNALGYDPMVGCARHRGRV